MSSRKFVYTAALIAAIPAADAAAIRVLVFDWEAAQHLAKEAAVSIAPLGPNGTTVAGVPDFNTKLTTGGPWDVVVIDCPGSTPNGGWQPTIDFVNAGGSCVMSFWDWDNNDGQGDPDLLPAFDLAFAFDKVDLVDGVTEFEATANGVASGIFAGVDTTNNDWLDGWIDDGDEYGALFSPGVTLGLIQGGSGIFRKGNGRAIACFVLDEAGPTWADDAQLLWKNMILHVSPTACSTDVNFDGSVGTSAPPTNLGPYQMTKFAADTACPPSSVTTVASPLGGSISFSQNMSHFNVDGGPASDCGGWATWSHGYTGDVYYTGLQGTTPLTIVMPPATGAFYLYVEPENFGLFEFTAFSNGGATSGSFFVDGASGAKYLGFYAPSGQLTGITITNVDGDADGFAVGEFGIARAGQIVFEDGPGTGAAPATLGPYIMNPFAVDSACPPATVTSVTTPVGGTIGFDASLAHYSVAGGPASACPSWGTWSHGYTGDVYFNDDTSVTVTMPSGTGAFSLYVEPNTQQEFLFVVTTNEGTSSGSLTIDGDGGARYVGFYANGGGDINSLTVVNTDGDAGGFAIGEFAIAKTACGLTCVGDLNADGLINGFDLAILLGQWTGAASYSPCAPRKAADLNGDCKINGFDLAILLGAWGPC